MEDALKRLVTLAFPQMVIGRGWLENPRMDIGRTDTDNMSEAEYNQWFPSQGRVDKSYPVASVVGPIKVANLLRKWLLGRAVKPKPTTAPLALSGPSDRPRLEGPPNLPRLTNTYTESDYVRGMLERLPSTRADAMFYDSQYDDEERYGPEEDEGPSSIPVRPRTAPGGVPTDLTRQNNYWLETERRDAHADRAWRAQNPYNRDYDDLSEIEKHGVIGSFPQLQGGPHTFYSRPQEGTLVNRIHVVNQDDEDYPLDIPIGPYSYTQDQIVMGPRGSETIDRPTQVGFTPKYGIPKGYYSALSKILAGDTLTKAEKESAIREIKYRQMASDANPINWDGLDVPSLTDHTALRAWMEKHPLEFTTRTWHDTLTKGNDSVSTLYFGGGNDKSRVHFTTPEGLKAQAFVSYNLGNGDVFNVLEAQSEMRGEGNPYMHQVIPKLAQQTVLDWADSGVSTITIPTGEAIFDKYYTTVGRGLWGDEKSLLKIKSDNEFAVKAYAFYKQPLIQKEAKKDVLKHIEELAEDPFAEGESPVGYDEVLAQRFGEEYAKVISDLALGTRRFGEGAVKALLDRAGLKPVERAESESVRLAEANLQDAIDILTLHRADKLKGLRSNYRGKVRHYNEYTKQVKKALKQHGANLFDEESDKETRLKITNPEETIRRTKKDGFTMAMLLKGIADRQVA